MKEIRRTPLFNNLKYKHGKNPTNPSELQKAVMI